jgi:hypothetical protein
MKAGTDLGKRPMLRFTASLRRPVRRPWIKARSLEDRLLAV